MAPCRCTLVTLAALYLLFMVLCPHRTTAPPTEGHLLLCQPYQEKCGDKFFDPLQQCCHDDAVVPLNRIQRCGNCTYKVCEEQCCPLLTVKPRSQDCWASLTPEDRRCVPQVLAQV